MFMLFFFQAGDGIRDLVLSRGLGDVYKRQPAARALCSRADACLGSAQALPKEKDPPSCGRRRVWRYGGGWRPPARAPGGLFSYNLPLSPGDLEYDCDGVPAIKKKKQTTHK